MICAPRNAANLLFCEGELPTNLVVDTTCSQTHSRRDLSSCFIMRSKNVCLENFRVLNGAGMGVLGMYSENITLDRLQYFCDERSHGIATNAADAIHLISCFGQIKIVDSILEGMKDDALNIHGNYYLAECAEDGVIHARLGTDVQKNPGVNAYYKMFGEGDTVLIYSGSTTEEKGRLTVKRVETKSDFTADLFVCEDTSGLIAGDSIENLSAQADLLIKNCRFGKARTHLRLQTRGKILIEDCDCSLKIALTGDKDYWYEGSPVNDLTIQNCRFTGKKASIVACPSFDVTERSPFYHSGIRVFRNTFDVTCALELSNCRDVLFEDNKNTAEKPFENRFNTCAEIIDK